MNLKFWLFSIANWNFKQTPFLSLQLFTTVKQVEIYWSFATSCKTSLWHVTFQKLVLYETHLICYLVNNEVPEISYIQQNSYYCIIYDKYFLFLDEEWWRIL